MTTTEPEQPAEPDDQPDLDEPPVTGVPEAPAEPDPFVEQPDDDPDTAS